MNWFKRKTYPQFWENYKSGFKLPQAQDINTIRFVIFDTETTGLNPKKDRILSIGCVAVKAQRIKISDQLECYLEQEHFNADTVKIHGLLKEGHVSKVGEKEALIQFLEYIKNAVLVAHHAAFDIAMINNVLSRQNLPKLKNKVLDTGQLFQKTKLDNSKIHFSLDELANRYTVPLHDRHTASGDAYITALLFLKIVTHLNKHQNMRLKDLMRSANRIGLL